MARCISSVSYIKPQLFVCAAKFLCVVYRPFPTSNHNRIMVDKTERHVVYRPFPTSNHNMMSASLRSCCVVYRPFPTSNHNHRVLITPYYRLYIVRFLHQTTTCRRSHIGGSWLYIVRFLHQTTTLVAHTKRLRMLYIVRFLHQTTTFAYIQSADESCISSVSYIKPQLAVATLQSCLGCISSVSYIKPQQSAHKALSMDSCISSVSYIKPQRNC